MKDCARATTSPRNRGRQQDAPVVHVSYANQKFSQSLELLRRSARKHGIGDFRGYTPEHPAVLRAAQENPAIFALKRGAGYWLWKPYILLDVLNSVPEGTLVIYSDAGIRYIDNPAPLIALAKGMDIVLFGNTSRGRQAAWTRRDCFVLMNADTPEHWQQSQLDASVQIYRAGTIARRFLEQLKLAMRDPRILTDQPNECGLPNFEDFQQHRHDQSVLTILAMQYGIEPQICPKSITGYDSRGPGPDTVFEHHRTRNVTAIRHRWWKILEALGIRRLADRKRKRRRRKR